MTKDSSHFKIRLPEILKKKISLLAKKNKRSMNAEILALMEQALSSETCNLDMLNSKEEVLKKIILLVTEKASKQVERELALSSLTKSERELLIALEMSKDKKELIIKLITSLINAI